MDHIPGWMSESELQAIASHCTGRSSALEIGTYCGLTTATLLNNLSGPVHTVDPLDATATITPHPDQLAHLRHLIDRYGDRLTIYPCTSQALAKVWHTPIEILVIDGDHSVDAVLHDLRAFTPFLRSGGILWLDDWPEPGTRHAWGKFGGHAFDPITSLSNKLAGFQKR